MTSFQDYDTPETPAPKVDLPLPKFDEIDLDTLQVKFADPKTSKSMACFVSIKHPHSEEGDRVHLIYRTPKQENPFGVSKYVNDQNGTVSWSLTSTFAGEEDSKNMRAYREFLDKLHEKLIDLFYPKCDEWVTDGVGGKKKKKGDKGMSKEDFIKKVMPFIRESDDEKYPDFVRETIANNRVKGEDGKFSYTEEIDSTLSISKYDRATKSIISNVSPETWESGAKRGKSYRAVHVVGFKINPSRTVLSPYIKVKQVLYYEAPPVDEYMNSFNQCKIDVSDNEEEDDYGNDNTEEVLED